MSTHRASLCRYHYDPLDRLGALAPAGEDNAQFFYCRSRLATQLQGALRCFILQADDHLLAQQQGIGANRETALLATDRQRSVLQAARSDQQSAQSYTAYGYQAPDSGLASLMSFNGERRDPVTGHYLLGNGYRAFNPMLMRFNSPDSVSPFGDGGLNAYAYCQGDPVNYVDPDGHLPAFLASKAFRIGFPLAVGVIGAGAIGAGVAIGLDTPLGSSLFGVGIGAVGGAILAGGLLRVSKTINKAGRIDPTPRRINSFVLTKRNIKNYHQRQEMQFLAFGALPSNYRQSTHMAYSKIVGTVEQIRKNPAELAVYGINRAFQTNIRGKIWS